MKIERFYLFSFSLIYFFLSSLSVSISADLIEPSRTLEGQKQNVGMLSVFSDPPELDVFLDGVDIGKTPIFLKEVTTGVHILRIKDTEQEVTILTGKSTKLSFFKNILIEIPENKEKINKQGKSDERLVTEEKNTGESKGEEEPADPFYWPLNPRGPIK